MRNCISLTILILASLFASLSAHPTYYPDVYRNESCYKPTPAKIYSYHIHLLYVNTNQQQVNDAYRIRDAFVAKFKSQLGPDSKDLFHNDYNCMLEPDTTPAGPFPTADWSVVVLPESLLPMMQWMTQYREKYTVLVHPNSGCEVEDHSDWALWNGDAYPLDITIFSKDKPFPW